MIIRFTYYSMIQFFIVNFNTRIVILRINCKNKKKYKRNAFFEKKYDSLFFFKEPYPMIVSEGIKFNLPYSSVFFPPVP